MTDTKTPTAMTIAELGEALASMSDDEIRAGFAAETGTDGHKARSGATDLYAEAAETRSISLTEETTGDDDGDVEDDTALIALARSVDEISDRLTTLEGAIKKAAEMTGTELEIGEGTEFPTREEVLKLHRRVESLASHLNFRLPS